MSEQPAAPRRRMPGFGPTVLLGLGGAALTAVAAAQGWARASGAAAGVHVAASVKGSASAPLAVALGLVALAAWGVVLVLRGRLRRAVAVLGLLASGGVLAATVAAHGRAQRDAVQAVVAQGGTGDAFSTGLTGWYYVCVAGSALTLVAFAVAVATAAQWPAMGNRYDAPSARTATNDAEPDMWRALDDGRDPTA